MAVLFGDSAIQVDSSAEGSSSDVDLTLAYVIIGILGALIWDVFSNLPGDYELIRNLPIGVPTIIYFMSRITTLLSFAFSVRFYTAVNVDCTSLLRVAQWAFAFGLSLTTLLFVFRARAVYTSQKWVANFFFIIWLGVVAASVVETQKGSPAIRQEPSGYCITTSTITSFIMSTIIVPLVHDIIIFIAITWKLVKNSHEELSTKKGLMVAIFGRHLPAFSRTLLRDGQAYFLTTVLVSIIAIGLFCVTPKTTSRISALFAFINMGVMHLMACKIYRKTRLRAHATEREPSLGSIEFRVDSFAASNVHNLRLAAPSSLQQNSSVKVNDRGQESEQQRTVDHGDNHEGEVVVDEKIRQYSTGQPVSGQH